MRYDAVLNVNGSDYPVEIEPHRSLLSVVRTELGLPGSKEGCDDSECGACMMLVDGSPVNSCSYLALQAQGHTVVTVEGLSDERGCTRSSASSWSRAACSAGSARRGCSSPPRRSSIGRPIRARTRSGSRSPGTCAGAPAIRASSGPCRLPPRTWSQAGRRLEPVRGGAWSLPFDDRDHSLGNQVYDRAHA